MPLIYRGCPQFIPQNKNQIKWGPLRCTITDWIQYNLECPREPNRLKSRYPEIVFVRGWQGSDGGLYEPKQLNGMPSLSYITDVTNTRTLFAAHHIDLPAGNVTPEQGHQAINAWVLKTFEREWRVIPSGLPVPRPQTRLNPMSMTPTIGSAVFLPYLHLGLFGACVQHRVAATLHSCIPIVLHAASKVSN